MPFEVLAQYGPLGLVLAVFVVLATLFIKNGYGLKIEVGPKKKS